MSWLCQRDAEKAKNSHSSYSSHLFYLGSFSGTAMDTGMFNTLLELLFTINVSLVDTVSKLGVKYPKKQQKRDVNTHFQAKFCYIFTLYAPLFS